MREFTVYKPGEFTVMPNYHLKDKELSLKAIGLLSKMLNLPDEWDYSLKGLVAICKESYDTIRSILNELKDHNYIEIIQSRNKNGTFRYNYLIFTNPAQKAEIMRNYPDGKYPYMDKPNTDKPNRDISDQYNTNKYNTNELIDKKDKTSESEAKHNILTNELINMDYISNDDNSSFYFDDLFNEYLKNGYSFREMLGAIHYIVPRVISRNFIDEEGNQIKNKYGYFKNAMESNFKKLNSLSEELYPDDPSDSFWDGYEL